MNIGAYLGAAAFPIAVCAMMLAIRLMKRLDTIESRRREK
jgi:hypothetical protein